MNRQEFVDAIVKKTGVDKRVVDEVVMAYNATVGEALKKGEDVQFLGFGTFKAVAKPARKARNPKTGETIKVAAKKVVKFKAGTKLVDTVNKKKK